MNSICVLNKNRSSYFHHTCNLNVPDALSVSTHMLPVSMCLISNISMLTSETYMSRFQHTNNYSHFLAWFELNFQHVDTHYKYHCMRLTTMQLNSNAQIIIWIWDISFPTQRHASCYVMQYFSTDRWFCVSFLIYLI